ncbi:MAG: transposase [Isosphaerales bacterium]
MTIARREQIDTSLARWYHCMTRCVRQAFLLAEGTFDRKEWIEDRLEELAQVFAVGVGGFSVMDKGNGRATERATSGQPRLIRGSVT